MSVLIKGMEMPKSCFECRFSIDGFCYASGEVNIRANEERQITNYCPLIPVREHGDLIGREWLIDIALHLMNTAKNDDIANGVKWLWQYIIEAPTIIPADPSVMYYPQVPGITPTVISDKEGET